MKSRATGETRTIRWKWRIVQCPLQQAADSPLAEMMLMLEWLSWYFMHKSRVYVADRPYGSTCAGNRSLRAQDLRPMAQSSTPELGCRRQHANEASILCCDTCTVLYANKLRMGDASITRVAILDGVAELQHGAVPTRGRGALFWVLLPVLRSSARSDDAA
eukprot:4967749-Pleurochrysis_carterae.AAC.1